MNIGNIIVGYYFYVLIFGIIAAFIFHPPLVYHKNLRRIVLILNSLNIIIYLIVGIISIQEKMRPIEIFKIIWSRKRLDREKIIVK